MPLDVDLARDCTIKCTDLVTFSPMPYAPKYVTGLFVRIKASNRSHDDEDDGGYILGRIRRFETCPPYSVNSRDARPVDVLLVVDSLKEPVRISNVSNRNPTAQEVENYQVAWGLDTDLQAELSALRDNIKKLKNHVPSKEEGALIIRKNTELNRSKANPVVELASLQRRRSVDDELATQRLSSTSALFSPQRFSTATLPLGEGSFSQDGLTRFERLQHSFSQFVAQDARSSSSEHLRVLTERNKAQNDANTVKASENFTKYAKHGHFTQTTLCWEVNDEKRAALCEEQPKEEKKEATTAKVAARAAPTEAEKEAVHMAKVAKAAQEYERLHCFSFDDLIVVDPEQLEVVPSSRLAGKPTKRNRGGVALEPTQVL